MIALVFSPMPHTKSIGLADLPSMTYPKIFAQQPEETSHCYTLFLDGSRSSPAVRLASSAPRGDGAAMCGSERPLRRGRAADLCEGHGGRGQRRWPWPRKGFRSILGVSLARWRKGFGYALGCWVVLVLAVTRSPLELRVKEMRWNE